MNSWKAFPLQKVVEMLEEVSGSLLVRVQGNMVDEAKLCSPIHSTFEVLVAQHAVGHCPGEELGPFC